MATIVCQGLQSCLDSHLVEPRTLRLKFSAPVAHHFSPNPGVKSWFPEANYIEEPREEKCLYEEPCINKPVDVHDNNKATSKTSDLGGWSFLQAVSNISQQGPHKEDKENMYIPPQVYKTPSATKLTEKSLELCTEDLGSETGTIITEDNIFSSDSEAEAKGKNVMPREQQKQRQFSGGKKGNVVHSFPPPLTTISGSDSIQVRPHREDGRLIMKAVKAPTTQSCFQAERSNGRLRLCFSKNFAPNFDSEEIATQDDNEGCENDRSEEEEEAEQQDQEVVGENKEEDFLEQLEDDDDEREKCMCLIEAEEVDGNSLKVGGEEGMDKFGRPSRCKDGGEHEKKGLLNWEPFWVAT